MTCPAATPRKTLSRTTMLRTGACSSPRMYSPCLLLCRAHALDEDVAHLGDERAGVARLVAQVDLDRGELHVADLDVAHEDVLDDAAAQRVGLEAQRALELAGCPAGTSRRRRCARRR